MPSSSSPLSLLRIQSLFLTLMITIENKEERYSYHIFIFRMKTQQFEFLISRLKWDTQLPTALLVSVLRFIIFDSLLDKFLS